MAGQVPWQEHYVITANYCKPKADNYMYWTQNNSPCRFMSFYPSCISTFLLLSFLLLFNLTVVKLEPNVAFNISFKRIVFFHRYNR